MVLFLVSETLQLLDLYRSLREDSRNVTSNGILLKQHAREQLTNTLNASFSRKQPWTEGQVAVKFKNLRSEYVELTWLKSQPGFRRDGVGLSDEWWKNIKRIRPKAHAFRGKLPWIFEEKMKVIVGECLAKREQAQGWINTDVGAQEAENEDNQQQETDPNGKRKEEEVEDDNEEEETVSVAHRTNDIEAPALRLHYKRKRQDEASSTSEPRVLSLEGDSDDNRSLAKSVEESSVAAAGMVRGFQDIISMFQEEAARCRALEEQEAQGGKGFLSLSDERRMLFAIAKSLEHSTRATADIAKGYRDLVSAYVRETADIERRR